MDRIRKEFKTGFHEGWSMFWAPFTGLWQTISETWRRHVTLPRSEKHPHA